MFKDPASAIRFGERYAAKSNIKSQMSNLINRNGVGEGEEVWDIAMTISARVAQCTPQVNALALKCVYGSPVAERDEILGEQISNYLIENDLSSGKAAQQLKRLGLATVKAERTINAYKQKYSVSQMAKEVGVSRQQFCNGLAWVAVRFEAMNLLHSWLSAGNREMELWLDEQNWFETGYIEEIS